MPKVDANVSDLFFNTDVSDCKTHDAKGQFRGFDEVKLLEEAKTFSETFGRASGIIVDPTDLMQDFLGRI